MVALRDGVASVDGEPLPEGATVEGDEVDGRPEGDSGADPDAEGGRAGLDDASSDRPPPAAPRRSPPDLPDGFPAVPSVRRDVPAGLRDDSWADGSPAVRVPGPSSRGPE